MAVARAGGGRRRPGRTWNAGLNRQQQQRQQQRAAHVWQQLLSVWLPPPLSLARGRRQFCAPGAPPRDFAKELVSPRGVGASPSSPIHPSSSKTSFARARPARRRGDRLCSDSCGRGHSCLQAAEVLTQWPFTAHFPEQESQQEAGRADGHPAAPSEVPVAAAGVADRQRQAMTAIIRHVFLVLPRIAGTQMCGRVRGLPAVPTRRRGL